jgi:hypothetical protein
MKKSHFAFLLVLFVIPLLLFEHLFYLILKNIIYFIIIYFTTKEN